MSSSSLENEDLVNVALVRMEDVQPSRNRALNSRTVSKDGEEVYETCIIDNIEYENECVVNDDDDSNIGSMVSLQSEEIYEDDSSNQELIIPEVLDHVRRRNDKHDIQILLQNEHQDDSIEAYMKEPIGNDLTDDKFVDLAESSLESGKETSVVSTVSDAIISAQGEHRVNPKEYILHAPLKSAPHTAIEIEVPPNKVNKVDQVVVNRGTESWPTLEILPGGVIKNTDKFENDSYLYPDKVQETAANSEEMMYACAKCSQTFKYLFCLVKHVKWHEDQNKCLKMSTSLEQKLDKIKKEKKKLNKAYMKQQKDGLSRVGGAVGKIKKIASNLDKT